jgi:hypothetical protein
MFNILFIDFIDSSESYSIEAILEGKMDFKYILLALFGLGAFASFPLFSEKNLENVTTVIESTQFDEVRNLGQQKITELVQSYSVDTCWSSVTEIFNQGLWLSEPLIKNIERIKQSCLGSETVPTEKVTS